MNTLEKPFEFNHAFRLGMREWAAATVALSLFFAFWPRIWAGLDRFRPCPEYRAPHESSDDYWFVARWLERAAREFPCLAFGDSVVWGQYVDAREALSAQLNEALGKPAFGNAGIDGLHPAAMRGLLAYYGGAIRGRRVLLHLNPLWMAAPAQDLRSELGTRFNHPRLVPRILGRPPCLKSDLKEAASVVAARHIEFIGWVEHFKRVYFEGMSLPEWSMLYPSENPLRAVSLDLPEPARGPRSKPVSWREGGIPRQDFPWMKTGDSFQWSEFRRAVRLLEKRGNRVFVLVGPFNTHVLTPESEVKYAAMLGEIKQWLSANDIAYVAPETLPSDLYADASHPLQPGYERLAKELLEDEAFSAWLGDAPRSACMRSPGRTHDASRNFCLSPLSWMTAILECGGSTPLLFRAIFAAFSDAIGSAAWFTGNAMPADDESGVEPPHSKDRFVLFQSPTKNSLPVYTSCPYTFST